MFDAAAFDPSAFDDAAFLMASSPYIEITDIRITRTSVRIDAGENASVGTLSTTGGEAPVTYTLATGDGDDDNSAFGIDGNQLICLDPEALGVGIYSIRVKAEDAHSALEKVFSIRVVMITGPQLVTDLVTAMVDGLSKSMC